MISFSQARAIVENELREEVNKIWCLKIARAVYSYVTMLMAFKKQLQLTQRELMELKSKETEVVETGSERRLRRLADLLSSSGIVCEVLMVNDI